MVNKKMILSISIVNYNTKEILRECLNEIVKSTEGINTEILVVDNDSTDGSQEMIMKEFSNVLLICNNENRYFSGGHNQNLKRAIGKYILILNPDVLLNREAIHGMIEFILENKKAGAVFPKSIRLNETVEKTAKKDYSFLDLIFTFTFVGHLIPLKRNVKNFEYNINEIKEPLSVDVGQASCFLIKKEILQKVDYFDENLKLYFTDDDLCRRIRTAGYKIFFIPSLEVIHLGAQSTRKVKKTIINEIYQQDLLMFCRKYYSRVAYYFLKNISLVHEKLFKIYYLLGKND